LNKTRLHLLAILGGYLRHRIWLAGSRKVQPILTNRFYNPLQKWFLTSKPKKTFGSAFHFFFDYSVARDWFEMWRNSGAPSSTRRFLF
jgi:hypothetical protein